MRELIFKNLLFDLDGTLVDSFHGIADSLRYAVSVVDPSLNLSGLKNHIGPPLPKMLALMWPDLREDLKWAILQEFRADYNSRGSLFSKPYDGVPELLNQLKLEERLLFVLTNKPQVPTLKILRHLGLEEYFTEILSPDSVTPQLATKSAGAFLLSQKYALIAEETLLIGDSQDDLRAAEEAGFTFVEASYGYGICYETVTQNKRLRLKTPRDLAKLVG
jgi:phosphoglycolate phosphatase